MTKPPSRKFFIGQRIWLFDENHRVYPKTPEGKSISGPPIFAEYFRPYEVAAIDGRSYLIKSWQSKWPHSDKVGCTKAEAIYCTDAERDDRIWCDHHRHRICDMIRRSEVNAAALRKIAEIIGYKEQEPT